MTEVISAAPVRNGPLNHSAVLVTVAMVIWALTEAIAGTAFGRATPVAQIVWLRYAFHLAIMVALFGVTTRFAFVRTTRLTLHLARSLLMLVMPMSFALASRTESARHVLGVFWIAPLLVTAMSRMRGEAAGRHASIALFAAWAGSLVVYRPPVGSMGWAAAAAVCMSLSFSGYIVVTRELDRTEPLLTNLFYSAVGVFIALSLAAPLFWVHVGVRQLAGGASVAATGLVALWLLEKGIRGDAPSRLAPFLFTQVVVQELLLTAGRGRLPSLAAAAGIALVVGALAVAFRDNVRRPHSVEVH